MILSRGYNRPASHFGGTSRLSSSVQFSTTLISLNSVDSGISATSLVDQEALVTIPFSSSTFREGPHMNFGKPRLVGARRRSNGHRARSANFNARDDEWRLHKVTSNIPKKTVLNLCTS